MLNEIISDTKNKMNDVLESAKTDFSAIQTGRPSPNLFSKIMVEYYGLSTPLQQLASITVQDARVVIITPYDKSQSASIEKAIRESNLGVSTNNESNLIRVILPEMTEERRKSYIKIAKQKTEEAKIQLRRIRHKAKEAVNKMVKDSEVSEDEGFRTEKELDNIIKGKDNELTQLFAAKEKDLMSI
jgi:ribosome recycling factor